MNLVARAFRIIAPVIAALQLAVFTGAPVYESLTLARQMAASSSVSSPDSEQHAPGHDSNTCPACQTLRMSAWLPDLPRLVLRIGEVAAPGTELAGATPEQLARQGFRSRAPPHRLG